MTLSNYHTHSTFCDGENTIEENILSAINMGMKEIGFSGHVTTDFDDTYCMQDMEGYRAEVKRLKEKYKGKIDVLLGIEEDLYSIVNREEYDYIIGSSHYLFNNGKYHSIDHSIETFRAALDDFGSFKALTEEYYSKFYHYLSKRKPDIIGHFDLVTKFDEKYGYNNLKDPNYIKFANEYAEKVCSIDSMFEVNTGAICRGLRSTPYPSVEMLHTLKKNDAKLILSSDCHNAKNLNFYFEESKNLLIDIGFNYVYDIHRNKINLKGSF